MYKKNINCVYIKTFQPYENTFVNILNFVGKICETLKTILEKQNIGAAFKTDNNLRGCIIIINEKQYRKDLRCL